MSYSSTREFPSLREEKYKSLLANSIAVIAIIISLTALGIAINKYADFGDWKVFYAAASTLDPYSVDGYFNPVIGLQIISLLSIFDVRLAAVIWDIISIILAVLCVSRLSKDHTVLRLILSLTIIPIIAYLDMAQIGVLSLVSVTMLEELPKSKLRSLGAILGVFKPQIFGMSLLLFWKDSENIEKRIFLLSFLLSFAVYGLWITDMLNAIIFTNTLSRANDISIFPYGVPIGIVLFAIGYKKNSYALTGLSTLFLMPYVNAYELLAVFALVFSKINIRIAIAIYLIVQFIYVYTF